MRVLLSLIVGLSCAFIVAERALAAPATVEAVQYPAWLERGGVKKPLQPGLPLAANDRITTGAGARVYLVLPEGSRVKLGEDASFTVDKINESDGKTGTFRAALNVLKGAFRFTTDALAKANRREVDIRVATVTAGIRGTDLWGKAADDTDLVCLLEGKIAVAAEGQPQQQMDQPLTFYVAAKGQAPEPIAPVDPDKLKQWSQETEVRPGAGEARNAGSWRLVLARPATQTDALAWYDQLQAAGYPAKMRTVGSGKAKRYRVQISGFVSQADARGVGDRLAAQLKTPLTEIEAAAPERQ
ncbi:FecR domain-containing protein [Andreprevotia chitinilytica]|uniref:FecR domain-containing protein n=1 Tax=Andreprevotia chitinilytica TaxID=396808 RepID=UPI000A0390B3|nr:FecR domain-containing protein [Andreprevotia chitinilytica]